MSRRSLVVPAFLLCAALGSTTGEEPRKPVAVAEVHAPDFKKALASHKGKVVVIDCWATWCAPCVKKFPHFVEMHKKYAERGLVCVSVSLDKYNVEPEDYKQEKVVKFLNDKGAHFPNFILAEPEKEEKELTEIIGDYAAVPYMVIFDRNGKKVWTSFQQPRLDDKQLEKFIEIELEKKAEGQ